MKDKKIALIVLLTLLLNTAWGQTELTVNFKVDNEVKSTENFRFAILNHGDTINVFNSLSNCEIDRSHIELSREQDSVATLFEYGEEDNNWESVEYKFLSDTTSLIRVEIDLYFTVNDDETEFLEDFTVDKYYQTNSVAMESDSLKIGAQPVFRLISLGYNFLGR